MRGPAIVRPRHLRRLHLALVAFTLVAFVCAAFSLEAPTADAADQPTVPAKAGSPAIPGKSRPGKKPAPRTVTSAFQKQPLGFEQNTGHYDQAIRYIAHGQGYTVSLLPTSLKLDLVKPPTTGCAGQLKSPKCLRRAERGTGQKVSSASLKLNLLGVSDKVLLSADKPLATKLNYFSGNTPSKWLTGISTYARVTYNNLYNGINLVYYGNSQDQLEYDYEVAPGANPAAIAFNIEGASSLVLNAKGELVIKINGTELVQKAPVAYQIVSSRTGRNQRVEVPVRFVLNGNRVSFKVGAYNTGRPLVIDPTLNYSRYIGGNKSDGSFRVSSTADAAGNIYVTGITYSMPGSTTGDMFVMKVDPTGSTVAWISYLAGGDEDNPYAIMLDPSQSNLFVVGGTASDGLTLATSPAFPTTAGAYATTSSGGYEAFWTRLNVNTGTLGYSTFMGGAGTDEFVGAYVDASSIYLAGYSESVSGPSLTRFPVSGGAQQPTYAGGLDAVVVRFANPSATPTLAYSTYQGGADYDLAYDVVADSNGNAYVTGNTFSTDFPTAGTAYQGTNGGGEDVFVACYNPSGVLQYSTYLGGAGDDEGAGIGLVNTGVGGGVYVAGRTASDGLATPGAFQATKAGNSQAFVARFILSGSDLRLGNSVTDSYFTYLGGTASGPEDTNAEGMDVSPSGTVYVVGNTNATSFPTTSGAAYGGGIYDGFVTALDRTGSALDYSTLVGGNGADRATNVYVSPISESVYVTGFTCSSTGSFAGTGLGLGGTSTGRSPTIGGNGYLVPPFATTDCDAFISELSLGLTVTTLADETTTNGQCSLREAISNAEADAQTFPDCSKGAGADVIKFRLPLPATVTVGSQLADVTTNITLQGPGDPSLLTLAASGSGYRAFTSDGILTLANLTFTSFDNPGVGAVVDNFNTTNLFNSVATGNNTGELGTIGAEGGTLNIASSTISGNTSSGSGGGVGSYAGTVNIANSTISGNSATYDGGGISNFGDLLNVTNSTISGNTSGYAGGGIANYSTAKVSNSTVAYNTSTGGTGGGIGNENFESAATLTLYSTIVAANSASSIEATGKDIEYGIISLGYNLIGTTDGALITPTTGDQFGTDAALLDARLAPLGNNGGLTQTHLLLSDSPARDTGDPAYAGPHVLDQRGSGYPRIKGGRIDIGATEF